MKKKNPKIKYDKDSHVLSIRLEEGRSVDSEIQGNAVLDYGRAGKLVGVRFYNFSFDDFKRQLKPLHSFSRVAHSLGFEMVK